LPTKPLFITVMYVVAAFADEAFVYNGHVCSVAKIV